LLSFGSGQPLRAYLFFFLSFFLPAFLPCFIFFSLHSLFSSSPPVLWLPSPRAPTANQKPVWVPPDRLSLHKTALQLCFAPPRRRDCICFFRRPSENMAPLPACLARRWPGVPPVRVRTWPWLSGAGVVRQSLQSNSGPPDEEGLVHIVTRWRTSGHRIVQLVRFSCKGARLGLTHMHTPLTVKKSLDWMYAKPARWTEAALLGNAWSGLLFCSGWTDFSPIGRCLCWNGREPSVNFP